MDFKYLNFGAVGPLNGSMVRAQVRSVLGGAFKEFRKTAAALNTSDAYDCHGLHVYYDEKNIVKGIEFFKESGFTWKGQRLVGEKASKVLNILIQHGIQFIVDEDGFDVDQLGMSFYVPDIDEEDDAVVESLYVTFRMEG